MSNVVALPTDATALTVGRSAEIFLNSLANPNTIRGYATAIGKTVDRLGEHRSLSAVADDEVGEALESLRGRATVGTWNARRAAVGAWLSWCRDRGEAPAVPGWCKRLATPDSETRCGPGWRSIGWWRVARSRSGRKTLYRMLYETAARAEEILALNVEHLDLAGRRAPVKGKGARAKTRRRGQAREDVVLEIVYWEAGTARLLPRLLKGRTRGPVFTTHRRPGPGKVLGPRDTCPDTGLARLSYGQARAMLDSHTAHQGLGTGWDLHELRHSALTHLGEQGASLLLLMAKSRHKKPENVRRYFKPSHEAIAGVTSLLAPGDRQR